MAFKDNVGMTEELYAEMVESDALPPMPPGAGIYVFIGQPVTIRWIEENGKFVREDSVVFEKK
jgi:hypothetical protein